MTLKRKSLAVVAAGLLLVGGLAGCSQNDADSGAAKPDKETQDAKGEEKAPEGEEGAADINARPDECGLQELDGPAANVGPFVVDVKYFQPGEMVAHPNSTMWMPKYKDSQMHIEVDTKANAFGTNWGYSLDETPAGLGMMFSITDENGDVVQEPEMMMQMNAIDGSHYGQNLKKGTIKKPGTYKLKLTIHPPVDYDLHTDYITGVPEKEWFKPLTVEMDWKITQEDLDTIEKATVKDPMAVPDNCKKYPMKKIEDKEAEEALKKAEEGTPIPMQHMH